jgi:4'-phosphopantetheinyl transferase
MSDSINTTRYFESLKSEVHIWFCRPQTIQDKACLTVCQSVLSDEEMERYHRLHFEKDKHNYLVAHAMLRRVLSKYVSLHASQWQFSSNDHGKPELEKQAVLPGISFNISHTDGLCACIIALDKPCGIDIENIHRQNNLKAVAQRMFAEEELKAMRKSENAQQQFYHYWTLREAYVKALGTGLAGSSKEFYFEISANNKAAKIHYKNKQQAENRLWLFNLYQPTQEHVLSVALQSQHPVQISMTELDKRALLAE